eukprot:scaffold2844_cov326-Pavlova_lutheri.AAC.5
MGTPGRMGENRWIDPGSNTDPTIPSGMAAATHEKRPAKTNISKTTSVVPSIHRAPIPVPATHGRWHGFTVYVEAPTRKFGSLHHYLSEEPLQVVKGNFVMHEESTDIKRQASKHCNRSGCARRVKFA